VEQVLAHVPKAKRCQGHEQEQVKPGEKKSFWQKLGLG
jgi:hypothetical protein